MRTKEKIKSCYCPYRVGVSPTSDDNGFWLAFDRNDELYEALLEDDGKDEAEDLHSYPELHHIHLNKHQLKIMLEDIQKLLAKDSDDDF